MVDVDSELQGITRKASRFAGDKYHPAQGAQFCKERTRVVMCADEGTLSEDTRLSNPPCTLRSTGWNRWEWLCKNPQERVEMPFDANINSQMNARDAHRPVLPVLMDPAAALPRDDTPLHPSAGSVYSAGPLAVADNMPLVSWRDCATIEKY
jgi:hypothetical protein